MVLDVEELNVEDLILDTKDERLGHLSDKELLLLIKQYKRGVSVKQLLIDFEINAHSSMLVRLFPKVKVDMCPYCPAEITSSIASKTYTNLLDTMNFECWNCRHKLNSRHCDCNVCESERASLRQIEKLHLDKIQNDKKRMISDAYEFDNFVAIPENSLDFLDKVFLGVLLRSQLSENGTYIKKISSSIEPITPRSDFTNELVLKLANEEIIVPSVNSSPDAFVFNEDNGIKSFYINEVDYKLNVESKDSYSLLIERLMYPEIDVINHIDEVLLLWKRISLAESISYFLYQMNEVGYDFNVGEVTITTFDKLLENFSVAQIYNLIFRAVANSTRAYQSGQYTKKHAMNMVVASCRNQGERALAEKWDLKAYNRLKQLPESTISKFLFTTILKQPGKGFYECPNLDNLDLF